jgi:hypothetical protein
MPHWMASLQQLTDDPPATSSSRLPLFQQLHMRNAGAASAATNGWGSMNSTAAPPPGFQQTASNSRPEAHQLAEGTFDITLY